MIVRVGSCEFVLTKVSDSDRRVIAIRQDSTEICLDATKQQIATLADALEALARD